MHTTLRIAIAAAILMPAAAAFAGMDKFAEMDTDKDGRISQAEHTVGADKMFAKLDADNNGSVTAAEMDAAHAKWSDKNTAKADHAGHGKSMSSADKIAKIDSDGDGELTSAEHAEGAKDMFAKMDTDRDGNLTKDELEAGHRKEMADHR
ncbi:hypothetical protein [Chiayiivirga flava]|uniref:Ca2+-binding EF-hand superfamily protein n=1 Tax=Chiayiivirga flava TaxID=659595 RepID=A0A7W8DA53_9GAMM|nr:hypothetical protein [Chiayiivirga flava]MBB5208953.1 Ca2+-binding EF-hand superfamily protein [Chiayiivirga flava]